MDRKRSAEVTRGGRAPGPRAVGLVCAAAAAGALLSGCANDDTSRRGSAAAASPAAAQPTRTASPTGGLTEDQSERKALIPTAKVDYDQALRAAVAAVPASKPVSAELEGSSGGPTWDTEVAASDGAVHRVRVDAVSGKAGQPQAETGQDADDRRALAARLGKATVTAQQAAQTATAKTKGTVSSIELDGSDSGTVNWSVDVVTTNDWNKTAYDIDATDRKVLREHADTD
ncbi:PepSY domain-containing protein [Streptomyces sp. NPDC002446]